MSRVSEGVHGADDEGRESRPRAPAPVPGGHSPAWQSPGGVQEARSEEPAGHNLQVGVNKTSCLRASCLRDAIIIHPENYNV